MMDTSNFGGSLHPNHSTLEQFQKKKEIYDSFEMKILQNSSFYNEEYQCMQFLPLGKGAVTIMLWEKFRNGIHRESRILLFYILKPSLTE